MLVMFLVGVCGAGGRLWLLWSPWLSVVGRGRCYACCGSSLSLWWLWSYKVVRVSVSVVNFVLVAVCRRGFCGRSVVVVFWSYVFVEVVAVVAVVVVLRVVVVRVCFVVVCGRFVGVVVCGSCGPHGHCG